MWVRHLALCHFLFPKVSGAFELEGSQDSAFDVAICDFLWWLCCQLYAKKVTLPRIDKILWHTLNIFYHISCEENGVNVAMFYIEIIR